MLVVVPHVVYDRKASFYRKLSHDIYFSTLCYCSSIVDCTLEKIFMAFLLYADEHIWYNCHMNKQHCKEKFCRELLHWYENNARILPWRENRSPYRVWVSEIMLQQTRVEAVKPYFERFIDKLPDIASLATASNDTLSKLWEGLGYYHRVRNMKACAQICMEKFNGELPHSAEELRTLPGIGDYTAGAVASIAYDENIPAVDGNVLRVFSRVLVSEDDILKEKTKKKFINIIRDYIPVGRSADFNQALMELGALICVPNAAPRCNICPVAGECMGYQSGNAHRLPNKTKKKKRRIEKKTVCVLVNDHHIHLCQRPPEGLLAGLYEFDVIDDSLTKKEVEMHFHQYHIKNIISLHKAKHIFSHIEWQMNGFLVEIEKRPTEDIWCTWEEIESKYAIPTAYSMYRDALQLWLKRE